MAISDLVKGAVVGVAMLLAANPARAHDDANMSMALPNMCLAEGYGFNDPAMPGATEFRFPAQKLTAEVEAPYCGIVQLDTAYVTAGQYVEF